VLPIPLSDDNPTERPPIATIGIIAVNILAWVYELSRGVTLSVLDYGLITAWFLQGVREGRIVLGERAFVLIQEVPWPLSAFTAMFMHASWMHIIGNMWFLWIFGDNLEDRMGRARYLAFYLLCGLIAAAAQIAFAPGATTPMVGASGAIAGVLGGYALLYPHARVRCLWWFIIFVNIIHVPAAILLGLWFLFQFLTPVDSGVAWMAHVGGFLGGLALGRLFVRPSPPRFTPRVIALN